MSKIIGDLFFEHFHLITSKALMDFHRNSGVIISMKSAYIRHDFLKNLINNIPILYKDSGYNKHRMVICDFIIYEVFDENHPDVVAIVR